MRMLALLNCLILVCLMVSVGVYAKASRCVEFLSTDESRQQASTSTELFISYLNYLLNQGIIDESDLRILVEGIQNKHELINPIPHIITSWGVQFTHTHYEIHYENLNQYLIRSDLDQQKVLNWSQSVLDQGRRVKLRKREARAETKVARIENMKFHAVAKGKYFASSHEVDVELTHDFEVMTTPVTQWMWFKEMGKNPSHFKNGKNGLQPDHPVESITWYAAVMYANYMSRKHGLREVYDFSNTEITKGTCMEDGTLQLSSGIVRINGPSIYETEGYRLPTEAEQLYLLTARGQSLGLKTQNLLENPLFSLGKQEDPYYFPGVNKDNLGDYAWFRKNSQNQTHAVSEKKAFIIDGNDFYDLYGNVFEWTQDGYRDVFEGGQNPVSLEQGSSHVVRGGHYHYGPAAQRFLVRDHRKATERFKDTGFRLVRTVK